MSIATISEPKRLQETLVLENGARLSQPEFHKLYEQTEQDHEDFRAELIEGVVYVPSPLRRMHGVYHVMVSMLFGIYSGKTNGAEAGDNATLLLGVDSEPQPDLYLRVLPEFGGLSRTTPDDYVAGALELVVEIALSSRSLDLHAKFRDYQKYGVKEYLVLIPTLNAFAWYDLAQDRELAMPADRVVRSVQFPGLWLSVDAILNRDHKAAMQFLDAGLATTEHQQFTQQLQSRRVIDPTQPLK